MEKPKALPELQETIDMISIALIDAWLLLGKPQDCRFTTIAEAFEFSDKDIMENPSLLLCLEHTALKLERLRIEERLHEIFAKTHA
ncbi:MAG: hypothetical protein ABII07_00195 [Patescibacteria group bacterium]|nr:hypothetical protein [Patescibacteria group bacterium]